MKHDLDELRLVRRLFAEGRHVDPAARERARAQLQPRFAPPRSRVGVRAIAVAVALGAILTVGTALGPSEAARAAVRTLHQLASVAGDVELAAGSDVVVYERSERLIIETGSGLGTDAGFILNVRKTVEIWRTSDGAVVRRARVESASFPTVEDRHTWVAIGKPELPQPGDIITTEVPPGEIPLPDLRSLPSHPQALVAAIRDRWMPDELLRDEEGLLAIAELLARGDALPSLRADLFRAAAELPGIELLGTIEDPLGRLGVGLGLGPPSRRVTIVVDPDTSVLLSAEQSMSSGGSVVSTWQAYTAWATVPALGAKPGATQVV